MRPKLQLWCNAGKKGRDGRTDLEYGKRSPIEMLRILKKLSQPRSGVTNWKEFTNLNKVLRRSGKGVRLRYDLLDVSLLYQPHLHDTLLDTFGGYNVFLFNYLLCYFIGQSYKSLMKKSAPRAAWKYNFPPFWEIMTDRPTNRPSSDGQTRS